MHLARAAFAVLLVAGTVTGCSAASDEPTPSDEPAAAAESAESAETDTADPAAAALQEQSDALDAYVAAMQSQLPALVDSFGGMYSDITITGVHPDMVEYAYVYAEQMDAATATSEFDAMIPTLQSACDRAVFPEMARAGVSTDPKITYTYTNADGSTLWSHTFEPSA
ncbi:hypothetical protein HP550_19530 [Cellulomonas humilata]|uniref:Uncharacterized protein n=1 Tax=Cellulomonas humilata TaxID=144055 RepID=A0A7Y6DYB8_9CELL|nr:hypothetical protein [Cellulomonas humilata]NUU19446.1 hypothetical protein [Cellulomonas humilata]